MAPRILVVDDTQAIRRSVRFRIEKETDWEICGEAGKWQGGHRES